ncbi:MAG: Tm-1-like ATP-binding domain-containing protein, partial [Verrucomicrobiota bacterium]
MSTVVVLGTFDTKGEELNALSELIRGRGFKTLLVDVGSGKPAVPVDVTAGEIAERVGQDWRSVLARQDRGEWVALIARAVAVFLPDLQKNNLISGVVSLGGGGGTAIATAGMRALPIGFPKVMVSTLASGNVAPYVGTVDIVMMP